ncbi:hypothetical protein [Streptomyces syringium]|uniref:hypothetical protein n=1 Tax=Streptomyces syringium TaxID=76729 RepID=UPI00343BC25A
MTKTDSSEQDAPGPGLPAFHDTGKSSAERRLPWGNVMTDKTLLTWMSAVLPARARW